MSSDAAFMQRALRLASLSLGMTWPNPGVGCVLVRGDRIIGEGRHQRCGGLHAETSALAGVDARGATAYVTLAPCTRHGRQPPCVAALIAAGVARVVAAIADPFQDDAGPLLRAAGIGYAIGVGAELATRIHGGFLTRMRLGRPRITGKWAMSLDGRIGRTGERTAISCPVAYARMRRRRRAFDAVLVGAGTVACDDPALTTPRPRRHGDEAGPLRVVVAREGRLPVGRWCDDAAPTLVVHGPGAVPPAGVRGLAVADPHDPAQVAAALGALGVNDLCVEGGSRIHAAWMPLYDRIDVYVGAQILGDGQPVLTAGAGRRFAPQRSLHLGETLVWELAPRLPEG